MSKHIPNTLTFLNVLVGAMGCYYALQKPEWAIYFVLIAGIFDLLDGFMARILQASSALGKQLDSLADLVSFGVLPALALTAILEQSGYTGLWLWIPVFLVPFSALRLAKFNLSDDQHSSFRGLPTPANALMITALIYSDLITIRWFDVAIVTALSCVLLVSSIRLLALKFSNWIWAGNEWRFILIIAEMTGFIFLREKFLPFIIPVYIFISLIGNYIFTTVSKQE